MKRVLDKDTTFEGLREIIEKTTKLTQAETTKINKVFKSLADAKDALREHDEAIAANTKKTTNVVDQTVAHLTANPVNYPNATKYKASKSVDTLTTYAFVQRFAETDLGQKFGDNMDDLTFQALTRAFERYIAASNEAFRKHARACTMVAALVLAFAVNAPARDLFQYVMDNPEVADRIIADAESANQENQEQYALLQSRIEELTTEAANDPNFPNAEENDALQDASNELESVIAEIDQTLAEARGLYDIPLGYDGWFDRVCFDVLSETEMRELRADGKPVPERPEGFGPRAGHCLGTWGLYTWFGNVLLAGLLIGLGGPFWYRVYSSLSHAAQLLRVFRGNPRPESLGAGSDTSQPVMNSLMNASETKEVTTVDGQTVTVQAQASVDKTLRDLFDAARAGLS
ncbi:MAG: hypothetical protein AAGA47_09220 [Pseudomonadota bacterium]